MPRYEIVLENGRRFEVDADTPDVAHQAAIQFAGQQRGEPTGAGSLASAAVEGVKDWVRGPLSFLGGVARDVASIPGAIGQAGQISPSDLTLGQVGEAAKATGADIVRPFVQNWGPVLGAILGSVAGSPGTGAALGGYVQAGSQARTPEQAMQVAVGAPGATIMPGVAASKGAAAFRNLRTYTKRWGPTSEPGRAMMQSELAMEAPTKVLQPLTQSEIDVIYAGARRGMEAAPPAAIAPLGRVGMEGFRPYRAERTVPAFVERPEPGILFTGGRERVIPRTQEIGPEYTGGPAAGVTPPFTLGQKTATTARPGGGRIRQAQTIPRNMPSEAEIVGPEAVPLPPRRLVETREGPPGAFPAEEVSTRLLPTTRTFPRRELPIGKLPPGLEPGDITFPGPLAPFSRALYGLESPGLTSGLPQLTNLLQRLGRLTRHEGEKGAAAKRMFGAVTREAEDYITAQRPGWEALWDFLRAQSQQKRLWTAEELQGLIQSTKQPMGMHAERVNLGRVAMRLRNPTGKLEFTEKMAQQLDPETLQQVTSALEPAEALMPQQAPARLARVLARVGTAASLGAAGARALGLPRGVGEALGSAGGLTSLRAMERFGQSPAGIAATRQAFATPYTLGTTPMNMPAMVLGATGENEYLRRILGTANAR